MSKACLTSRPPSSWVSRTALSRRLETLQTLPCQGSVVILYGICPFSPTPSPPPPPLRSPTPPIDIHLHITHVRPSRCRIRFIYASLFCFFHVCQAFLTHEPPIAAAQCAVCSFPMELLVQVWCPMENSPMDRALYVWGCARSECQRKEGR
jgi:hypothetical protein